MSKKGMILDGNEYQRLLKYSNGSAFDIRDNHDQLIKQDLKERFDRSQKATRDWPDTKENIRQRRIANRESIRNVEEEQKVALDLEEEEYQSTKRAEAIARAKEHFRNQNERVRKLNSALALSRCLREREEQVKTKLLKERENNGVDDEYYHQIISDNAKFLEENIRKERDKRERYLEIERDLKKQMELKQNERLREREDELKIAEKLRLEDEMFVEKLRIQLREENDKKRGYRKLSAKTRDEAESTNQLELKLQKEEEENIQKYEMKKAEELRRRLDILEQEKRQKEELTQRVSQAYAKLINEREEKYQKMIMDREKSNLKRNEISKAKKIGKDEIIEHYRMKVDERERLNREAEIRKKEDRKKIDKALEIFEEECRARTLERCRKNRTNQEHILRQMEEKRQREEHEKLENLRYEKEMINKLQDEEKEFEEYAKKLVREAASQGNVIYPILKTVAKETSRPTSARVWIP